MIIIIRQKHIQVIVFLLLIFLLIGSIYIFNKQHAAVNTIVNEADSVYLPIIMYHEIKTFKLGNDVITQEEFESDLKYFRDNNYNTITMTQLIDYVYGNGTLPENPIILTFDDGYLNTYIYAFPLLKQYDVSIVFSIIGIDTDSFTQVPNDDIDYSHVTWDQLNEMIASGYVEVQNHTYNLHSSCNGRIGCVPRPDESFEEYEQVLADDIVKFQDEIFAYTGEVPNTFTYPYGESCENTDIILKELGFKASLSCDYGINLITKDTQSLFCLKRIRRSHGDNMEDVLEKVKETI